MQTHSAWTCVEENANETGGSLEKRLYLLRLLRPGDLQGLGPAAADLLQILEVNMIFKHNARVNLFIPVAADSQAQTPG